jgi:heterodisulfide reductase subunit B
MIEYAIYISMTVPHILIQTDPLSAQQCIITGHKFEVSRPHCVYSIQNQNVLISQNTVVLTKVHP